MRWLEPHPSTIPVSQTKYILGVRFTVGPASRIVELGLRGGLVVAPSAPVLVALTSNSALRDALSDADMAIADSGFMVLLWRLFRREKITRVSGLEYLGLLLSDPVFKRAGVVLWVMPNELACDRLMTWSRLRDVPVASENCYLAPQYPVGSLSDPELLSLVERLHPAHVIIGLGGGVQERLGHYLKHNLSYRPGLHCIGGAIGFLTGDQVKIPKWADQLYLGWLVRSISDPKRFVPRYLRAQRLAVLVLRYGEKLPPYEGSA